MHMLIVHNIHYATNLVPADDWVPGLSETKGWGGRRPPFFLMRKHNERRGIMVLRTGVAEAHHFTVATMIPHFTTGRRRPKNRDRICAFIRRLIAL